MKRKERYIASLDEVTITRDGDYAWIAYKEEGIGATRLQIGPEISEMSDREILELHNECLRAQAKRAAEYKHVAVEVPLGSAQIEALGRTLALELAPRRVNTVCPGFIDSGKLWKDLPAEEREAKMRDKAASDLLTARVGIPDDAAKSYLYAIQNPYVTGQTIIADGGASLT